MTVPACKAVVHRLYEEVFGQGNTAILDELLAADYVGYDPPNAAKAMDGIAAMRQSVERMAAAFPDRLYRIDELIAEGDLIAVRVTLSATHTGQFFDLSPTGRHISITGTVVYRFDKSKIAASWGNWDNLGLMRQLGLISR